jgi:hypothetical protein
LDKESFLLYYFYSSDKLHAQIDTGGYVFYGVTSKRSDFFRPLEQLTRKLLAGKRMLVILDMFEARSGCKKARDDVLDAFARKAGGCPASDKVSVTNYEDNLDSVRVRHVDHAWSLVIVLQGNECVLSIVDDGPSGKHNSN